LDEDEHRNLEILLSSSSQFVGKEGRSTNTSSIPISPADQSVRIPKIDLIPAPDSDQAGCPTSHGEGYIQQHHDPSQGKSKQASLSDEPVADILGEVRVGIQGYHGSGTVVLDGREGSASAERPVPWGAALEEAHQEEFHTHRGENQEEYRRERSLPEEEKVATEPGTPSIEEKSAKLSIPIMGIPT
jgi:hypothetical protein